DSGEVVRPCLRRRSATTSAATGCGERCPSPARMRTPRFVHFGTELERVRWFFKAQSPQAAREDAVTDDERRDLAAVQTTTARPARAATVRLAAIHKPAPSFAAFEASPVVVEQVVLADPRRASAVVRGSVKVHNLAFEKDVAVRYSLDGWRTAEEIPATYSRMLAPGQSGRPSVDRFEFLLPLPASALVSLPATLALCVRYRVAGAEHWDNNAGSNYSFRIALPAAPAIADDDCDMLAAAPAPVPAVDGLRAPPRLTFGDAGSSRRDTLGPARFAAPTAADTRRYMAQSAVLFGARPSPYMRAASPMHVMQSELPLFQDMAWGGITDALSFVPLTALSPPPPQLMTSAPSMPSSAAEMHPVFDADGNVRTGSPLAWSHNTTASALQC
ncbi:hypothetical protein H4R19_001829, partial [Coemansia spiralis]